MSSSHPDRKLLSEFVTGRLSQVASDEVVSHVEQCSACQQTLNDLGPTDDTMIAKVREAAAAKPKRTQGLSVPKPGSGTTPRPEASPSAKLDGSASPLPWPEVRQAIIDLGLASAEELDALHARLAASTNDVGAIALRELQSLDKLTRLQAHAISQGKTSQLIYGDYIVQDLLGEGGMGRVYKAVHRHMQRKVGLKVMSAAALRHPEAVKRFQREVVAAAKLSHPHIVQAYDAGSQRGTWYLVMEYVEGRDLAKVVSQRGPLPIAEAIEYTLQAARGLAFAHAKNVIHRDIKPANLLLDNQGMVKILDMGLARFDDAVGQLKRDNLTQTGQIMGTVDYMAPEQAEDTSKAGGKADVYSLGCTLFCLLTRRDVYGGDTLVKKILAHRDQAIPSLITYRSDVSPRLDSLFRQMIAKQPEIRPTMDEVVAELQAIATSTDSPLANPLSIQPGTLINPQHSATIQLPPIAPPPIPRAISVATLPRPQSTRRKPPGSRKFLVATISFFAASLLTYAGITIFIKNEQGKTIAEVKVEDGHSADISTTPEKTPEKTTKPTNPVKNDSTSTASASLPTPKLARTPANAPAVTLPAQVSERIQRSLFRVHYGSVSYLAAATEPDGLLAVWAYRNEGPSKVTSLTGNDLTFQTVITVGDIGWLQLNPSPVDRCAVAEIASNYQQGIAYRAHVDAAPSTALKLNPLQVSGRWQNRIGIVDRHVLLEDDKVELWASPMFNERGELLGVSNSANQQAVMMRLTALPPKPKSSLPEAAPLSASPPTAVAPFTYSQAKAHQAAWAKHLGIETVITNSIDMKLTLIPPGEFAMGSPWSEPQRHEGEPIHQVTLTKPFVLGVNEVTQQEYELVMSRNPSAFSQTGSEKSKLIGIDTTRFPVESVSWFDAVTFCNKLSVKEKLTAYYQIEGTDVKVLGGRGYRLPTESEWEYACRAGTSSAFHFGESLNGRDANCNGSFPYGGVGRGVFMERPRPIGVYNSNAWGLRDMHGNVLEWCWDWHGTYPSYSVKDPVGPSDGTRRICRGGAWNYHAIHCRSANRHWPPPAVQHPYQGLRVARDAM